MSITTRLWSKEELENIRAGTADKHLITIFLNVKSFNKEEIGAYPYALRRVYHAYFTGWEADTLSFCATDDESAWWFLEQEYKIEYVEKVVECITTYREVERPGRIS